jgi:hypothetical protein
MPVEAVCEAASNFSDEMPDGFVSWLRDFPYNICDGIETDCSYRNGARCLLEFMKLKRERYLSKSVAE